jgi:hypothetical protein
MEAVDRAAAQNADLRDIELKAGFYVVSGSEPDTLIPEEFLRRATSALRGAQAGGGGNGISRIRPFQPNSEVVRGGVIGRAGLPSPSLLSSPTLVAIPQLRSRR